MTPIKLVEMLSSIMPTALHSFKSKQNNDYCIYDYSINVSGSDLANELYEYSYRIEFYSNNINKKMEKKIMNLLDEQGIDYDVSPNIYIESEKSYMVTFTFSVLTIKED